MEIKQIELQINQYREQGKKMFSTSSFQSQSLVLLHILSQIDSSLPIYFINTGYHFPATLRFREEVEILFNLNVIEVKSTTPKYMQLGSDHKLLFTSDPDHCCYLNKTQPLEGVLKSHDIWINGIRSDQSAVRSSMQVEQPAPFETLRFHPMLDWTNQMIYRYLRDHKLPRHPMEEKGYQSIGCEPCTRKVDLEMQERESRWFGLKKFECGLHVDLVTKSD